MKVLHINEHLSSRGGVETYLHALVPLLEQAGVQTVALAGSDGDDYPAARHVVPALASPSLRAERSVRSAVGRVLAAERPDVIHVHNYQNLGVLQAALACAPTVITTHDHRSTCPAQTLFLRRGERECRRRAGPGCFLVTARHHCLTPRPRLAHYFYRRTRWITRRAGQFARWIAPSRRAWTRLVHAGVPKDRACVLPYFCSYPPRQEPRELPPEPVVAFVGRVTPSKGIAPFIRAVAVLPQGTQAVIVGNLDPGKEAWLDRQATAHGVRERLEVRPWASRSEVRELLERTTVLAFPSLWPETLGIVGLEALSHGVPVVASDIGGVPEWLEHERNGLLVTPGSVAELGRALASLVADGARNAEMGARGLDTIRERFLPERHVERLVALYREIS